MDNPVPVSSSVSVAYLQGVLDYLARQGLDTAALVEQVHVSPQILAQRDQRIAASAYLELLGRGVQLSGDEQLGLRVGEAVRPGYYGVLGYLIMSGATSPMRCIARLVMPHWSATWARSTWQTSRRGLAWSRKWRIAGSRCYPSQGVSSARRHWPAGSPSAIGSAAWIFPRREARLQHAAPADTAEYQRIFRCPVLFDQADNALIYPKRLLATPLGQADGQVRLMLDAYAERLLGERQRGHSVLDRARLELSRQLPEVGADLQQIAARLALSPRTLQRRLREAGLSFNQLVDQTRQQRVLHYLRDPALELAKIAFLVGFSEPGSLARALRRWAGQSPGDYRRQLKEH
jgi:AraC-like DNA-binding protein